MYVVCGGGSSRMAFTISVDQSPAHSPKNMGSNVKAIKTEEGANEKAGQPPRVKGSKVFVGGLSCTVTEDMIREVPGLLTPPECEAFMKNAEACGFVHQGSLGPTRGETFRDNDRISVHDGILAEKLWKAGLCNFFLDIRVRGKAAVGLSPNIRFYKYKIGQRFGQHVDESVDLGGGITTEYTLLIYLNGCLRSKGKKIVDSAQNSAREALIGGETVFYASRKGIVAEVAPIAGMALFHIHGDQCMLHEARVVSKGAKYVLRSDVLFA